MKKKFSCSSSIILFILTMHACSLPDKSPAKDNSSNTRVAWRDSTGGSQPDTLLVKYPPKPAKKNNAADCTRVTTLMLVRDSTGGSYPETTFVKMSF